jgi:hypothetical protein
MSFARQPAGPLIPQGFRQDLTYEQILREQVRVCLDNFNIGDRDGLERSLKALFALITPRIQDAEFRETIAALDEEWTKAIAEKELVRKKKVHQLRNGAPDLVPPVDKKPDMNHLGRQLYTVLSLLERKKLGLRAEVEESV